MTTSNLSFLIKSGEQAGLDHVRIIGHGYAQGVYRLGHDAALDAAIDGYLVALKAHDPKRGAFAQIAFRAMDSFRKKYLVRNMTHRERLHARMLQESQDRDDDGWSADLAPSAWPSPLEQAEHAEQARLLIARLRSLPPHYRDVLTALYLDGMSAVEYGRRIGKCEETVHRRRNAALNALRREFQS